MGRSLILAIRGALVCALVVSCSGNRAAVPEFDYAALNARAAEEYLQPVHPGIPGEVPFWNGYSFKFIYAPAFDFEDIAGAASYMFTATADCQSWAFEDASPRAALSPVWNDLPVGPVQLCVQALDSSRHPVGEPQKRTFERDTPVDGPSVTTALWHKDGSKAANLTCGTSLTATRTKSGAEPSR